jgi:hypothetical protein
VRNVIYSCCFSNITGSSFYSKANSKFFIGSRQDFVCVIHLNVKNARISVVANAKGYSVYFSEMDI